MPPKIGRRARRKLRRNAMLIGVLFALLIVVLIAFRLAPRNDDAPVLRVPTSVPD